MDENNKSDVQSIFKNIQEIFTYEIGPVADILCKEAFNEWSDELEKMGKRKSLLTIHRYISKLADHLGDDESKNEFIKKIYELDALKSLKHTHGN